MPRKAALPPREIAICRRLESFRRDTKIPRAVFARSVGFVPERLAMYESARAPIRYDAFRAINQHFFVSPRWLVAGEGSSRLEGPFDDTAFQARVDGRDLLSAVYDRVLREHFAALDEAAVESWLAPEGLLSKLSDFEDAVEDPAGREKLPTFLLERMDEVLEGIRVSIREALNARGDAAKPAAPVATGARRRPPRR